METWPYKSSRCTRTLPHPDLNFYDEYKQRAAKCCTLQESQSSACQPDWSLLRIRNEQGFISGYLSGVQARDRHLTDAALAVNSL